MKILPIKFRVNRKLVAVCAFLLFLLAQLAVPGGRVMPKTTVGSLNVGGQQIGQAEAYLKSSTKNLTVSINGKDQVFLASQVGILPQVDALVEELPTVSLKDRFIPFAPLYKLMTTKELNLSIKRDKAAIHTFATKISQSYTKAPADARAAIQDGKFAIFKDVPGVQYASSSIERQMNTANPFNNEPIKLTAKLVPAQITEEEVLTLKKEFEKKTEKPLTVSFGSITKTVSADELKKWLKTELNTDSKEYKLIFDASKAEQTLQSWAKEYNTAAGITQISYVDDVETARNTGPSGRALDEPVIKGQISKWIENPTADTLALAATVIPSTVVATRTYTRSSAQLQAKLDAWIAGHGGKYQVAIRELNGRGREASYSVSQQTVMASTYKIFLAFVVYKQADGGAINLGDKPNLPNGRSIEQCIEVMIVNSDNDCAVALGRYIGWAKADQIIAASGFEGIKLNNYDSNGNVSGDKMVNAKEQAKFLVQLSAGSLTNSTNTSNLIGYMKRQIYRMGIPAGSQGAPVADKVGFLDNYTHDVGIVYGPTSTYALVIMSSGSNFSNIKDLAQAVYDFMND
ncbi:serine hydrolase [Polaromonas sp.]|nr:serine hydrolase [Candidatus Saccharibacteria bacterium]